MSQTKQEFALQKINELVDATIKQECLEEGNSSFNRLNWIKFYAKELVSHCEECKGSPMGIKMKNKADF